MSLRSTFSVSRYRASRMLIAQNRTTPTRTIVTRRRRGSCCHQTRGVRSGETAGSIATASEQLVLAAEDFTDGVIDEDATDRVGQELRAGQHADVLGPVGTDGDRVGHDDLLQARGLQVLEGVARE